MSLRPEQKVEDSVAASWCVPVGGGCVEAAVFSGNRSILQMLQGEEEGVNGKIKVVRPARSLWFANVRRPGLCLRFYLNLADGGLEEQSGGGREVEKSLQKHVYSPRLGIDVVV